MNALHRAAFALVLLNAAAVAAAVAMAQAPSAAAASRVIFASGDVSLRHAGKNAPAAQGNALVPGDALTTGDDGKVQVRLASGAQFALQPASQWQFITATDELLVIMLSAGTLRAVMPPGSAVTVELRAERATMTVRGVTFSAGYNPDGTINIATERDPIEVCTRGGCLKLVDDGAVRVRADGLPPARTNARPAFK